jgi:hypothetical protein
MPLPKRREAGFIRALKYDAIEGRSTIVERYKRDNGEWDNKVRDITADFRVAADMKNLAIGWIAYVKGKAPQVLNLVHRFHGADHLFGIRVRFHSLYPDF